MNRIKHLAAALLLALPLVSCVSYKAYELAQNAESTKDWDTAVTNYEKALQIDPQNMKYTIGLQRAKLEASRLHFQKGKTLKGAADSAAGNERIRLATLAATEFELTVKLDTTNQYAAVELGKSIREIQDTQAAMAGDKVSIEQMKKRAQITKVQPPQLNPASNEPISLNFRTETPVKDIYRALGNAFGINILFDQAVKDDRISIELKDVTAQQALERVMQAANHFYKVLDEHTIIVVPDNPQARRDYEDLVIQTFYLSNGDAEQVTNVVRTMIEARNVFPLKALNAITIRDTADKVRIAQKIIEANDKAKAEVVVDVELLQMDLTKTRDIGFALAGVTGGVVTQVQSGTDASGNPVFSPITGGADKNITATLDQLRGLTSKSFSFSVPQPTYGFLKSVGNAELLANPELRISEGEKASLHIGQRIPVPVSTFTSAAVGSTTGGTFAPVTSYQYQDVGIKVAIEPRVHHNSEVTLKLTVEVSNLGTPVSSPGQPDQPTFATRTIESTIRLKDGETNFLAGLIQDSTQYNDKKTPFLGDIPILGRFFTESSSTKLRTDLVLTMTPHIVRMPDITEDDVAPMWVGTQNNLTFRGVSPRIESQSNGDPFVQQRPPIQVAPESEGGVTPNGRAVTPAAPAAGTAPTNVFQNNPPNTAVPPPPPNPEPQASNNVAPAEQLASMATLRMAPRMGAEPVTLKVKPGEQKVWNIIGMDLEGLNTDSLVLHYDSSAMDVSEVVFGSAMNIDPRTPPVATINRDTGTIKITSSDGKPLQFISGGDVVGLRLRGGKSGETALVIEPPELRNTAGTNVMTAVTGGRAQVE
jgi:general secretion pathway protein D